MLLVLDYISTLTQIFRVCSFEVKLVAQVTKTASNDCVSLKSNFKFDSSTHKWVAGCNED